MNKRKKYYPLYLDISGKSCIVVGGGRIALRKVKGLLEADAKVKVIADDFVSGFESISKLSNLKIIKRRLRKSDLKNAFLLIAATDDKEVNREIAKIGREKKILVNVVDSAKDCDFILPATVRRGNLTISISTNGTIPLLSRKVRESIEDLIGSEYTFYASILSQLRSEIYSDKNLSQKEKMRILEKLSDGRLLDMIKRKASKEEIKKFVESVYPKK